MEKSQETPQLATGFFTCREGLIKGFSSPGKSYLRGDSFSQTPPVVHPGLRYAQEASVGLRRRIMVFSRRKDGTVLDFSVYGSMMRTYDPVSCGVVWVSEKSLSAETSNQGR